MKIQKTLVNVTTKNKKPTIFNSLNFKNINFFQFQFFFWKNFFSWLLMISIMEKRKIFLKKKIQNIKTIKYYFFLKKKFIFLTINALMITKSIQLFGKLFQIEKDKIFIDFLLFLLKSIRKTPIFIKNLITLEFFKKKKKINYLENSLSLNQKNTLAYNYLRQVIINSVKVKVLSCDLFKKILRKILSFDKEDFFEICFFCIFSRIGIRKELSVFSNCLKKISYFFFFFKKKIHHICKNFLKTQRKFFSTDLIRNKYINWNWNLFVRKTVKKKKTYSIFFFEKFFQSLLIEKIFLIRKRKIFFMGKLISDRKEKTLENSVIRLFQIILVSTEFKIRKLSYFFFFSEFLNFRINKKKTMSDFLDLKLNKKFKKIKKNLFLSNPKKLLKENFLIAFCYKKTKKFQKKKKFQKNFLTDFRSSFFLKKVSLTWDFAKEIKIYYFKILKKSLLPFFLLDSFLQTQKKRFFQTNFSFIDVAGYSTERKNFFEIFSIKENIFFFLKKIIIKNFLKNKNIKLEKLKAQTLNFKKNILKLNIYLFFQKFQNFKKKLGQFVFEQKNSGFVYSMFSSFLLTNFFFREEKFFFSNPKNTKQHTIMTQKEEKNSNNKKISGKIFHFCFGKNQKNFKLCECLVFSFISQKIKFFLISLYFRKEIFNFNRDKIDHFFKNWLYNQIDFQLKKKNLQESNDFVNISFLFFKSKFFIKLFENDLNLKLLRNYYLFRQNFSFWFFLFPQVLWNNLKKQKEKLLKPKTQFFNKNTFYFSKYKENILEKNFYFLSEFFLKKTKICFINYKLNKKILQKKKFSKKTKFKKGNDNIQNQKIIKIKQMFFSKFRLEKNFNRRSPIKTFLKKNQTNFFRYNISLKKKKKFSKSNFIFLISMFFFFFIDFRLIFKSAQRDPVIKKFEKIFFTEISELVLKEKNFFLFKNFLSYFFKIFKKKEKIQGEIKKLKNKYIIFKDNFDKFILKSFEFISFFSRSEFSLKNFFLLKFFKLHKKILKKKNFEKRIFLSKKKLRHFSFYFRLRNVHNHTKNIFSLEEETFNFVKNKLKLFLIEKYKKKQNRKLKNFFFFENLFLKKIIKKKQFLKS